jgi:D-alanyl-D-alanine carboxypeptidase/D-alanyl-D-alanine-endopeptidase (penicillin-binding protein 4)
VSTGAFRVQARCARNVRCSPEQRFSREDELLVKPLAVHARNGALARLAVTILTLASAACAPGAALRAPRSNAERLAHTIDSIIAAPPLHRTHWGIVVRDPRTAATIYAVNAERHFIPASNTKLVVGVVALGTLGPDFRFETPLYISAAPGDTVATHAVLVGSGDPTLSARFHGTEFAPLDSLAAAVSREGIRVINELVIDASRFDPVSVNGSWEVGDLPFTYAPPVGSFAVAEGTFGLERAPGPAPGSSAWIAVTGGADLQPIASTVTTDTVGGRTSLNVDYLARRDTIYITGSVALGARLDTTRFAVTDPVGYAGRALAAALRRNGIGVSTLRIVSDTVEARALRDATHARLVTRLISPPLDSIVAAILRPSQNWIAEQMLLTLGAQQRGQRGWTSGIAAERRYLVDVVGLDSLAFSLRDASGLSAQNLLTPSATVQLLQHASISTWGPQFRSALAAPGLRGSTLSNRLESLEGRLVAKTGTIANVNSLSGFVTTGRGRELAFAIFTNGSGLPSATVRQAIDAIVLAIAQLGDPQ